MASFDAVLVNEVSHELPPGVEVIQTVAYEVDSIDRARSDAGFVELLTQAAAHPAVSALLIDAARAGVSGGLGVAFDWEHASRLIGQARQVVSTGGRKQPRIILAGGLRAENVGAAIAAIQPDGVDVASGVEARPRAKDPERLRAFIAAARMEVDRM